MEEEAQEIFAAEEEQEASTAPTDQAGPIGPPPRRLFSSPPRDNGEGNCDNSGEDDQRVRFNSTRPMNENNEGSIVLSIPNLSSLRSKINTPYHYIANLPWRLAAKTEKSKRTSDVKFFSVYIDCNPESESTLWSCDAVVEFKLISQKCTLGDNDRKSPHFSREFSNRFNFNSNNWGFPSFMEYNEIVCPEKGFVRNDKILVEANIVVQKVVGVRSNLTYDFLSHQPNVADIVLVIDGRKLHVSKSYLALYSPVFHAMFFSNFREREKNEIVVADVVFEEFVEMLSVVYPSHKPVNAENVEFLLELADKFEIQYIMEACEKYLIQSDDIRTITKLVWADQYFLAELQDCCLRSLKTVQEIRAIRMTEDYKNLSDVTKAALFEKLLKIVP